MEVQTWLAPALIAAFVSGLVNVAGWFVTFRIGLRRDRMLREEKVHDFQVALKAEIASDLLTMVVADRAAFLAEIGERYAANSGYSVVVPHMASNPIFDSIVPQIHILPGNVIEPVVHYERFRETVERFVKDMREPAFATLARDRQMLMYSDYLDMLGRLEALAQNAAGALAVSLSNPAGGRSTRGSASAGAGASAVSPRGEP